MNTNRRRYNNKQRSESRALVSGVRQFAPTSLPMIVHARGPSGFLPKAQTFPSASRVTMRWGYQGTLVTAAGAATVQTVRLTSLYDPDFTGAGNQPRYYDTLCAASGGTAPYNTYRVKKTHFSVTFMNNNSTAATAALAYVNVFISNQISLTSAFGAYYDTPNVRAVQLSSNGQTNAYQTVQGTVDIAKFVGNNQAFDDEDLEGAYNANPALNVHLACGVRSMDDTTVATHYVLIQLVYEAEFFGLNDAGAS